MASSEEESFTQGCGVDIQISGSSSGLLTFLDPALPPTSRNFWLRLQNNLVQKIKKNRNICITCMPQKQYLLNRNLNLRIRLHNLKIFGSGHPKLLGLRLHIPGFTYAVTTASGILEHMSVTVMKFFIQIQCKTRGSLLWIRGGDANYALQRHKCCNTRHYITGIAFWCATRV